MFLAEKLNLPIITFIDTAGAFPGKDAEERGQLIRRLELLGERIYKDKILVKGSQTASNMATDLNQASNAVQAVSDVANRRVGNTLIMLKTLFNLKL